MKTLSRLFACLFALAPLASAAETPEETAAFILEVCDQARLDPAAAADRLEAENFDGDRRMARGGALFGAEYFTLRSPLADRMTITLHEDGFDDAAYGSCAVSLIGVPQALLAQKALATLAAERLPGGQDRTGGAMIRPGAMFMQMRREGLPLRETLRFREGQAVILLRVEAVETPRRGVLKTTISWIKPVE